MIVENVVLSHDFIWTDIERPLKGDLAFIESEFGLPRMLLLDSVRPGHLPKYELSENCHFFLLRMYDSKNLFTDLDAQMVTSKLAIFIQGEKVVSIHQKSFVPLRKFADIQGSPGFPENSRDLIHQLFRLCILSFEEALSQLKLNYEAFERIVLSKEPGTLSHTMVYEFRRKLYIIKGVIQHTQQTLQSSRNFWSEHSTLHQDIKENLEQLYFRLESLGQNFDQLFALNLNINEQRNNDVMKVLTVFASVMLPLTFIASFYGMNFDHLPGLHTTKGFVGAILIMATTSFVTIWFFSKKKWFRPSM